MGGKLVALGHERRSGLQSIPAHEQQATQALGKAGSHSIIPAYYYARIYRDPSL
jgi:hypothetical protein